jgi:hypothetical protein
MLRCASTIALVEGLHMNFLAEFDACFYRADLAFELHP